MSEKGEEGEERQPKPKRAIFLLLSPGSIIIAPLSPSLFPSVAHNPSSSFFHEALLLLLLCSPKAAAI